MKRGYVVKARAEHVIELACNIRDEDRREINAWTRSGVMHGLYRSYRVSTHCWTAMLDDKVLFMFGVAPISVLGRVGSPWLIAAKGVEKVQRQFIRECRDYLKEMLRVYPELRNYVDVRNNASIRWLEWMGFTLGEPVPFGLNGEPFIPFARRAA